MEGGEKKMINYTVEAEKGIVTLRPSGPLQKADFESLAEAVDKIIEGRGTLKGIVIHAPVFPGWESFGSFVDHMRFVRDHHRRIKRVAAAVDGRMIAILPKLAQHFVGAEVKHFSHEDVDRAREWVLGE